MWMKNVFAGQLGLTFLLEVILGLQVGRPLDILPELGGWDATTRTGRRTLNSQMSEDDPYFTIITMPCGPWGSWSRFNLTKGGKARKAVLEQRRSTRPMLKMVANLIVQRVQARRHVLVEQPLGGEAYDQDEFMAVRALVSEGKLMWTTPDGCMLGYYDLESGFPYKKPMRFLTFSDAIVEYLESASRCDGSHYHQTLEGSNKYGSRTRQAAEWPTCLDVIVKDAIL